MLGLGLGLGLLGACSFDSTGGGGSPTLEDEDEDDGPEDEGQGESAESPGESMTSAANSSTSGDSGPPPTADPTSGPPPEDDGEASTQARGSTTTDPSGTTEQPEPVDCSEAVVLMQSVQDAEVFPPMVLDQSSAGTPYAASGQAGAGAVRFTFDVACPSTYRLYARVWDGWAGVHDCCDPDSFEVEAPGVEANWFYGCDTETQGFTWLAVKGGQPDQGCSQAQAVTFELSPGQHEITFRNREGAYEGAVAAISELVLTNDTDYQPGR